jgi:hypothetical protein
LGAIGGGAGIGIGRTVAEESQIDLEQDQEIMELHSLRKS